MVSDNDYHVRHFSLLVLLILLTACATSPTPLPVSVADPDATWQARNRKLADLREWSIAGRIAIRTDDDGWNVNMHWRQQGDDYRIRFNAPLALGAAEIVRNSRGVVLRTTNRRTFHAADPESLLFDTLGWYIPISGLRNWILGCPEKDTPIDNVEIDSAGRSKQLNQSGWEIRYLSYRRIGNIELPIRLELENIRFGARIRISRWVLPPF
uniref:Outer-membrane lipoprotein LolB n=1 Tax=Candidatus Kentrum sp. TUN TaxID=2126343 RepID=A0A451A5F2_9GAMM|nr:MAG: outer membrane lipoprotein LolB [Candidatus Kentron sp. TUN]VFK58979.1 MAG: outer membrane lipoprotein LolB [Candidatus Kentron sp. TUN]VFK61262.1 MAG: outer membrane lipoprotein LolB [Candidatus Kentron sp. TUN]